MDPGPRYVRRLALRRLPLVQRLGHEPAGHQLRPILLGDQTADLPRAQDHQEGRPHDLLGLGHLRHRLAPVDCGLALHRGWQDGASERVLRPGESCWTP